MLSLNNAQDLLQKCERDLNVISNCPTSPDYDYAIFDAVITLSHLFEWYLKDGGISNSKKIECMKRFNPYQSRGKVTSSLKSIYQKLDSFPSPNTAQLTMRELCNKAKHFTKKVIENQEKNYQSVSGQMYAGGLNSCAAYFEQYVYTVDIDGINEDLENVLRNLLDQWLEFEKYVCANLKSKI